jgi:hypothetical protein
VADAIVQLWELTLASVALDPKFAENKVPAVSPIVPAMGINQEAIRRSVRGTDCKAAIPLAMARTRTKHLVSPQFSTQGAGDLWEG